MSQVEFYIAWTWLNKLASKLTWGTYVELLANLAGLILTLHPNIQSTHSNPKLKKDRCIPGCSCDDLLSTIVTYYPVSSHSIFPGGINPSINLHNIPPAQSIQKKREKKAANQSKFPNKLLYIFISYFGKFSHVRKIVTIPRAIFIDLNMHTSDHPYEFPLAHLSSRSKPVSCKS